MTVEVRNRTNDEKAVESCLDHLWATTPPESHYHQLVQRVFFKKENDKKYIVAMESQGSVLFYEVLAKVYFLPRPITSTAEIEQYHYVYETWEEMSLERL